MFILICKVKIGIAFLKKDFVKVFKHFIGNFTPKTSGLIVNIFKDTKRIQEYEFVNVVYNYRKYP